MSLPYFKFHPAVEHGNYQIMSLDHAALGVWYLLRMIHLWPHQGRIPDDANFIAPLLKLDVCKWEEYRAEFLKRGMVQIIDGCVTIAAFREQWEGAAEYSEMRSANRKAVLQKNREKKLLKSGKR